MHNQQNILPPVSPKLDARLRPADVVGEFAAVGDRPIVAS